MMQERITFNGATIKQPIKFDPNFASTSSEDSGNTIDGTMHNTVLFTKESFNAEFSDLTLEEMSLILQQVVGKNQFMMHYLSPYYGKWRDDYFYVAEGSLTTGTWKVNEEKWESLSFSVVGVNKIL